MGGHEMTIGLVFLAGLVSFVSPCVLPIMPVYLSVISGMSYEELTTAETVRRARWRLFGSALAFLLGFGIVTVLMLGVPARLITGLPDVWKVAFQWTGGIITVIFALHLLGVFRITALLQERRFHVDTKKLGYLGVLLVGAAFAFGWTPCTGLILTGVFGLTFSSSANPADVWRLLVAYVLGMAVPFLLAAVFVNLFLGSLSKMTRHLRKVEIVTGVLLLVMAVMLVTNSFSLLNGVGSVQLNNLHAWLEGKIQ